MSAARDKLGGANIPPAAGVWFTVTAPPPGPLSFLDISHVTAALAFSAGFGAQERKPCVISLSEAFGALWVAAGFSQEFSVEGGACRGCAFSPVFGVGPGFVGG